MKVNGKMIENMDLVYINGIKGKNMKEIGLKIEWKDMVYLKQRTSNKSKDYGKIIIYNLIFDLLLSHS